jgi:hypothetical protein
MPDVLREAGLKVALQKGWERRGRGTFGDAAGIMVHHTATKAYSHNYPSLGIVTNGRSDLPGPLCNLGVGRDGTFYVVAAGIASHAGKGNWRNISAGNSRYIGVECENDGIGEVWAPVMLDSMIHGFAALLKHMKRGAEWCHGHKEFALPPGRKIDPFSSDPAHPKKDTFNMDQFRRQIAMVMGGNIAPVIVPPIDGQNRPTLWRGMKAPPAPAIMALQKMLGIDADGDFGPKTEAAVRKYQREHPPLVPDGRVGPKTWSVLEQKK